MHERRFNREIERLRDPERIARLEVDRVVGLALQGLADIHTVLDIGMGSGVFSEQFASRGLKVTGVDVNPHMLPAAQKYVPGGTFYEAAAESLPFHGETFDLVFMGLLLHETDDVLAALREAYRTANCRLAVLEWPDEDQKIGPPREHRLADKTIQGLAEEAGFHMQRSTRLENLILYIFEK